MEFMKRSFYLFSKKPTFSNSDFLFVPTWPGLFIPTSFYLECEKALPSNLEKFIITLRGTQKPAVWPWIHSFKVGTTSRHIKRGTMCRDCKHFKLDIIAVDKHIVGNINIKNRQKPVYKKKKLG